ncbi:four helix bundle protein [Phragmitibacter flavus]|uniref:Four helix bundle protein n=1 Tax=Phragmitibacter flavus TaxID=2576071 RepID=A0A5R8K9J7_9BACT|nr:four helix bundle protein [Phragmitibacter flavus]TLD68585.1 four helix bundle protein [Phragmitibacter flavus]
MKDKEDLPADNLGARTKRFALDIIDGYTSLPPTEVARVLGRQILRSGTSVGSHYREASRSRSDAEFVSKLEVALQELEETRYWLELLLESSQAKPTIITPLHSESTELIAIFTTIVRNRKNSR